MSILTFPVEFHRYVPTVIASVNPIHIKRYGGLITCGPGPAVNLKYLKVEEYYEIESNRLTNFFGLFLKYFFEHLNSNLLQPSLIVSHNFKLLMDGNKIFTKTTRKNKTDTKACLDNIDNLLIIRIGKFWNNWILLCTLNCSLCQI